MKKLITTLAHWLIIAVLFAQVPEKMSYQAVVRNANGELVKNTTVSVFLGIQLRKATSSLPLTVYQEKHSATTNANGLLTLQIGGGIPQNPSTDTSFGLIDWGKGPLYIKAMIDPAGGTNYSIVTDDQLLSVPYALYSKKAETVSENDPVYSLSQAAKITENDITNLSKLSGKNTGDQDLSALATKAYVDSLLMRIVTLENTAYDFTDSRDGNFYNAVKVGNQVWMAENLRYLPSVFGPTSISISSPRYYVYNYIGTNVTAAKTTEQYNTYGVLYNWSAAINGGAGSSSNPSGIQGICPAGWHLPSDAEWTELTTFLGGENTSGGKLKETGTIHWNSPNTGAINSIGFKALPGGYLYRNSTFNSLGSYCYWWSSTEADPTVGYALCRMLSFDNIIFKNNGDLYNEECGFSVRCVRN